MELSEILSAAKERHGLDAAAAIELFSSDDSLDFAESVRRDTFSTAVTLTAGLELAPDDTKDKLKYRAERLAAAGHRRILLTLNGGSAAHAAESVDILLSIERKRDEIRRADVFLPSIDSDTVDEQTLQDLKNTDTTVILPAGSDSSLLARSIGLPDVGLFTLFTEDDYLRQLEILLRRADETEPRLMLIRRDESLPSEIFERICQTLRLAKPFCPLTIDSVEDIGLTKYATGLLISQTEPLDRVVNKMIRAKLLPSFCSACRAQGRAGEIFCEDCRTGKLHNFCYLNALISLKEYLTDFGTQDTRIIGTDMILRELYNIRNDEVRSLMVKTMKDIRSGTRNISI